MKILITALLASISLISLASAEPVWTHESEEGEDATPLSVFFSFEKEDIERVCRNLCRISTAHRAHPRTAAKTARFRRPPTMALLLTGPPERSYLSPHLSPSLTCMVQCNLNIPAISRGTSPVGTHSSMPLTSSVC